MSNSAPFDVKLVIARLQPLVLKPAQVVAGVPFLRQVRGSADYAAIQKISDFIAPEAFVLLARERGGQKAGVSRQPAAVTFGVVTAARNYSEPRGMAAGDDVSPLVGAIRDLLIGWPPGVESGGRPIEWVQGDVLDYDKGTLLWRDIFKTQHFIGRTQQ